MTVLPRGVAQQLELIKQLNALAPYPSSVVNLRYSIDEDWTGDPAIFFWVTLTDQAAARDDLHQNALDIEDYVVAKIDPMGKWDLIPYFNFRSKSEQDRLNDPTFG